MKNCNKCSDFSFCKHYSFDGVLDGVDISNWTLPDAYKEFMNKFDIRIQKIEITQDCVSLPAFKIEGVLLRNDLDSANIIQQR